MHSSRKARVAATCPSSNMTNRFLAWLKSMALVEESPWLPRDSLSAVMLTRSAAAHICWSPDCCSSRNNLLTGDTSGNPFRPYLTECHEKLKSGR